MIAALAIFKSAAGIVGAIAGWIFADWHRVVALIALVAVVGAYVIGDVRGRHAGDAAWQAKLSAQGKAFIAEADRAATAEHNRQVAAAKSAQSDFDRQAAARDRADAANTKQMEAQLAAYQSKIAALGRHYGLSADDLRMLDAKP